jgi:hypothetical protein
VFTVELSAIVQPIAVLTSEGVIVPTEGEPTTPPEVLRTTPKILLTPDVKLVSLAVVAVPATSVMSTENVFDAVANSIADIVYILYLEKRFYE